MRSDAVGAVLAIDTVRTIFTTTNLKQGCAAVGKCDGVLVVEYHASGDFIVADVSRRKLDRFDANTVLTILAVCATLAARNLEGISFAVGERNSIMILGCDRCAVNILYFIASPLEGFDAHTIDTVMAILAVMAIDALRAHACVDVSNIPVTSRADIWRIAIKTVSAIFTVCATRDTILKMNKAISNGFCHAGRRAIWQSGSGNTHVVAQVFNRVLRHGVSVGVKGDHLSS